MGVGLEMSAPKNYRCRTYTPLAEKYAKATAVLAAAAVDGAEQAALEAWLARKDSESDAKAA
jgi:hypothetical protein